MHSKIGAHDIKLYVANKRINFQNIIFYVQWPKKEDLPCLAWGFLCRPEGLLRRLGDLLCRTEGYV